jgi:hypothetical protein
MALPRCSSRIVFAISVHGFGAWPIATSSPFASNLREATVVPFVLPGRLRSPKTEDHCGSPFHSTKVHVACHNFARMDRSKESLNSKTSNLIRVYAPDQHETCDVKISTHFFPERHRRNGNKATRRGATTFADRISVGPLVEFCNGP